MQAMVCWTFRTQADVDASQCAVGVYSPVEGLWTHATTGAHHPHPSEKPWATCHTRVWRRRGCVCCTSLFLNGCVLCSGPSGVWGSNAQRSCLKFVSSLRARERGWLLRQTITHARLGHILRGWHIRVHASLSGLAAVANGMMRVTPIQVSNRSGEPTCYSSQADLWRPCGAARLSSPAGASPRWCTPWACRPGTPRQWPLAHAATGHLWM